MAEGFKIADGYVEIHSDDDGFEREARASTLRIVKDYDDAGKDAGEKFTDNVDRAQRDSKGRFTRNGKDSGSWFSKAFDGIFQSGMSSSANSVGPLFSAGMLTSTPVIVGAVAAMAPVLAGVISGAILGGAGLGIIGLGALVLKKNKEIVKSFTDLKKTISTTLTTAAQPMVKPFLDAIGVFKQMFKDIQPDLKAMFTSVAGYIKPLAIGLSGAVKAFLPGFTTGLKAAKPIFDSISKNLPGLGKAFGDFFAILGKQSPTAGKIIDDVFKSAQWLLPKLAETLNSLIKFYAKMVDLKKQIADLGETKPGDKTSSDVDTKEGRAKLDNQFGEWFVSKWKELLELSKQPALDFWAWFSAGWANVFKGLWEWFSAGWGQVWEGLKGDFAAFGAWFVGGWATVLAGAAQPFIAFGQWFAGGWAAIWNGLMATFSAFGAWFLGGWNTTLTGARNALASFWSWFTGGWGTALAGARNAVTGFGVWFAGGWLSIWNSARSSFGSFTGWLSGAWNSMRATASAAWSGMRSAIGAQISAMMGQVRAIPGMVAGAFSGLGGLLYSSGQAIIRGLVSGISSMIGPVRNAVSNVLSAARAMLPFSPAKEGPFSGKGWTLYSGQAISLALAQGITDKTPAVQQAIAGMTGTAQAGIPTGYTAPASTSSRSVGDVHIHIAGTFDFEKPGATRELAERIRTEIRTLEREVA